jgi:putative tryptophan/tyrosine transport system substrate-binding protein
MFKKIVSTGLLFAALLPAGFAGAQQPAKTYRIGFLSNAASRGPEQVEYQQALHELGYIEGQNLVLDWRFSKGKINLLPDLAADLVRLKPDCIIASGVAPTRAAKNATSSIPIVMGNADDDPVRHGLVASLAHPGGNVTGFTNFGSDLAGKRLELIKEIFPKISRVAIVYDPTGPGGAGHAREAKVVAPALAVELQPVEVQRAEELDKAFQVAVKGRAEALIIVHTGLMNPRRSEILNLALKTRLPAMYSNNGWVLDGGLMGYDADARDRFRGVASYVDKILKGAKPADLPVERPRKFELVINLKTAKQIGLTIPPNVLARADRVIK